MKYILEMDITPEQCAKIGAYPSFVISEILMNLGKQIHDGSGAPGINVDRPGERSLLDYHGNKVGTWKVMHERPIPFV